MELIISIIIVFGSIFGTVYLFSIVLPYYSDRAKLKKCLKILYPRITSKDIDEDFKKNKTEEYLRIILKEIRFNNYVVQSRKKFTENKSMNTFDTEYYTAIDLLNAKKCNIKAMGLHKSFRQTILLYAIQNPLFRIDFKLGLCRQKDIVLANKEEIISLGESLYGKRLIVPDWINDKPTINKYLCKSPLSESNEAAKELLKTVNI